MSSCEVSGAGANRTRPTCVSMTVQPSLGSLAFDRAVKQRRFQWQLRESAQLIMSVNPTATFGKFERLPHSTLFVPTAIRTTQSGRSLTPDVRKRATLDVRLGVSDICVYYPVIGVPLLSALSERFSHAWVDLNVAAHRRITFMPVVVGDVQLDDDSPVATITREVMSTGPWTMWHLDAVDYRYATVYNATQSARIALDHANAKLKDALSAFGRQADERAHAKVA